MTSLILTSGYGRKSTCEVTVKIELYIKSCQSFALAIWLQWAGIFIYFSSIDFYVIKQHITTTKSRFKADLE